MQKTSNLTGILEQMSPLKISPAILVQIVMFVWGHFSQNHILHGHKMEIKKDLPTKLLVSQKKNPARFVPLGVTTNCIVLGH